MKNKIPKALTALVGSLVLVASMAIPAQAAVWVGRAYATSLTSAAKTCVYAMDGDFVKGNGSLGTPFRDALGRTYWSCWRD